MATQQISARQIPDDSIVNAHINSAAAIASSKLAAWSAARDANSFKLVNLAPGTAGTDAINLNQLNSAISAAAAGLAVKEPARAASTADVSTTYNSTGGASGRGQHTGCPDTLDGVSLAANDRILLKNQSPGSENGIYVVSTLGTGSNGVWDRAEDFDEDSEVVGSVFIFVQEGSSNADTQWVLTTDDTITIGGAGGTVLTWSQFGAGQTYTADEVTLTLSSNEFSIKNGGVDTAQLAADAVDGSKIANDSIDSEHYVDGSIDTVHIAADAIVSSLIADEQIDSEHYVDGSIDGVHIANDAIDSQHYAAGSIDNEHLAANSVDSDNYVDGSIDGEHIANDAIDSQHYAAGSIDNEHLAVNSIDSDNYVDGSIDGEHIANAVIDSQHYVAGSIDNEHLAANSVDSDNYVDGSIDNEHLSGGIKGGKLALISQSVTGTPNDVLVNFTMSAEPTAASLLVFVNGMRQRPTTHFTFSGTTLTFTTPPETGDTIAVFGIQV